jgi:hypothetical protein
MPGRHGFGAMCAAAIAFRLAGFRKTKQGIKAGRQMEKGNPAAVICA